MNKNKAIYIMNEKFTASMLNIRNTHWSNLVEYGSEIGWWLNVPFHKFEKDLYLVLNDEPNNSFYCIKIPAQTATIPQQKFRNKQGSADIFMPSSGRKRMVDTQSGSSEFDFNTYKIAEVKYEI